MEDCSVGKYHSNSVRIKCHRGLDRKYLKPSVDTVSFGGRFDFKEESLFHDLFENFSKRLLKLKKKNFSFAGNISLFSQKTIPQKPKRLGPEFEEWMDSFRYSNGRLMFPRDDFYRRNKLQAAMARSACNSEFFETRKKFLEELANIKDPITDGKLLHPDYLVEIAENINENNYPLIRTIFDNPEAYKVNKENFIQDIRFFSGYLTDNNLGIMREFVEGKRNYDFIENMACFTHDCEFDLSFISKFLSDKKLGIKGTRDEAYAFLGIIENIQKDTQTKIISSEKNEIAQKKLALVGELIQGDGSLLKMYKFSELKDVFKNVNEDNVKFIKKFAKLKPEERAADCFLSTLSELNEAFTQNHCHLLRKIYKAKNIDGLSISEKRNLLHQMISNSNDIEFLGGFGNKYFPLLVKYKEKDNSLIQSLIRSLSVKTKKLNRKQLSKFNSSVNDWFSSLSKISDADFAAMKITQEYSKTKFSEDVFNKVNSLTDAERRKVFDYFRFEVQCTQQGEFRIIGYPLNLNTPKRLAKIKNKDTKAAIQQVAELVDRFTENNPIHCDNKDVEKFLNEVVDVLPELRTTIDKKQHGVQAFDIMKHSLKVMQKVAQDEKFAETVKSDSDRKIMLLASLLHDITKAEGKIDGMHALEGSMDAFYIAKKFKLERAEEIKLYKLIKNHEWLKDVNTAELTNLDKQRQSVAFELHCDNLFEMAEIFTRADMKAIKADDSFYERFKNAAAVHAEKIKAYIEQLKKTQPWLPQTKIPSASRIKAALEKNPNLKGVYVSEDGLVIIKYNEVKNEDWEKIGFPKGSISRGIKCTGYNDEKINTGNIKFFVHGMDDFEDLNKFSQFVLPDSDAVLSVSYAERPESKFHFFCKQGLILDVDPRYIHGGGESDTGSGFKKTIQIIKDKIIFNKELSEERSFVSSLIKKQTGWSDKKYVKLYEENKDKCITQINPKIANKIIKALATINSSLSSRGRKYNEIYVSNPKPVGVFAYSEWGEIGNPIEFLKYQGATNKPLYDYARKNNLPVVLLGA